MPDIVYLACPDCRGEFYVGPEFLSIPGSYCCCPYCHREFRAEESSIPLRFDPGYSRRMTAPGGPGDL